MNNNQGRMIFLFSAMLFLLVILASCNKSHDNYSKTEEVADTNIDLEKEETNTSPSKHSINKSEILIDDAHINDRVYSEPTKFGEKIVFYSFVEKVEGDVIENAIYLYDQETKVFKKIEDIDGFTFGNFLFKNENEIYWIKSNKLDYWEIEKYSIDKDEIESVIKSDNKYMLFTPVFTINEDKIFIVEDSVESIESKQSDATPSAKLFYFDQSSKKETVIDRFNLASPIPSIRNNGNFLSYPKKISDGSFELGTVDLIDSSTNSISCDGFPVLSQFSKDGEQMYWCEDVPFDLREDDPSLPFSYLIVYDMNTNNKKVIKENISDFAIVGNSLIHSEESESSLSNIFATPVEDHNSVESISVNEMAFPWLRISDSGEVVYTSRISSDKLGEKIVVASLEKEQ